MNIEEKYSELMNMLINYRQDRIHLIFKNKNDSKIELLKNKIKDIEDELEYIVDNYEFQEGELND